VIVSRLWIAPRWFIILAPDFLKERKLSKKNIQDRRGGVKFDSSCHQFFQLDEMKNDI